MIKIMNIVEKTREVICANRKDDAVKKSSEMIDFGYSRVLRFIALAGIFYGANEILFAINAIWLHWSGIAMLMAISSFIVIFLCFTMIYIGSWSAIQCVIWLGMAIMIMSQTFMTLLLPGGALMCSYGFVSVLTIIAAIWYFHAIPEQYAWSKNALAWWVIGTQLVFFVLFWIKVYYLNYVVDQFEPALPYAEDSVFYVQNHIWCRKYIVMGNGIAMLLSSIYLYYVARKQNK